MKIVAQVIGWAENSSAAVKCRHTAYYCIFKSTQKLKKCGGFQVHIMQKHPEHG